MHLLIFLSAARDDGTFFTTLKKISKCTCFGLSGDGWMDEWMDGWMDGWMDELAGWWIDR